jgi:hypothetical protein
MPRISFARFSVAALFVGSPVIAAPSEWWKPYSDDANTMGLWHFDDVVADGQATFADDDSLNTGRNNDGTRQPFSTAAQPSAAGAGPGLGMFGLSLLGAGSQWQHTVASDTDMQYPADGGFTIEAWIKPTASDLSGLHGIANKGGSSGFDFFLAGGKVAVDSRPIGSGYQYVEGTTTLQADTWYHVAAVFDGNYSTWHDRFRLYVNGVLDRELETDGNWPINGSPLALGTVDNSISFALGGELDEVRYSNIARTFAALPAANQWAVDADGNWTGLSNWTADVPNGPGALARFGSIITQNRTVTLDLPITVGRIEFDNSDGGYTLAGDNSLSLSDVNGAGIDVQNGSHVIAVPITLQSNTTVNVAGAANTLSVAGQVTATGITLAKTGPGSLLLKNLRTDALILNAGSVRVPISATENDAAAASSVTALTISAGSLDLENNALVIDYSGASPIADIRSYLASGALLSSAANASTSPKLAVAYIENTAGLTTFHGQLVDSTSLLVAFALSGDSNLDNKVNTLDFNVLSGGFGSGNAVWGQGDFNYDGSVDSIDFTRLIANYGATMPASSAFGSAVPEPTCLCFSMSFLLFRRRR